MTIKNQIGLSVHASQISTPGIISANGLDVINKVNIYKYDKVYEIGHTPDKNPFKKE